MKFKKITLLVVLLCVFNIQAQVNESPFSQFPETLTIEEWSDSNWDVLATSTATFNSDCLVEINTTSLAGIATVRTLYSYSSDNLLVEIITQGFNANVWVNISRMQNTYEGNILTEETGSFWDGADWLFSSKIINIYNGASEPSVQLYQVWNFATNAWDDNSRIVYSYNASGLLEQELYQNWNTMTMSWDNEERDIYLYSGSIVSGLIYDVWDGSDWEPDQKSEPVYNDNQQIVELITSEWSGTEYELDSRTLFAYSDGLIAEFVEQNYIEGTWENEVRSTYTYPSCAALSTAEYESIDFSFYPNPSDEKIKLLNIPQEFSKVNYMLYDMSGRLVQSDKLSTNNTISTQFLTNGLYVLKLSANSNSITKPLVVKH